MELVQRKRKKGEVAEDTWLCKALLLQLPDGHRSMRTSGWTMTQLHAHLQTLPEPCFRSKVVLDDVEAHTLPKRLSFDVFKPALCCALVCVLGAQERLAGHTERMWDWGCRGKVSSRRGTGMSRVNT